VIINVRNAGGKPNALSRHGTAPDQQYRILARTWQRNISCQEIIDSEVTVGLQSYPGFVESGGRSGRPTEERGVNARPSVGSDAIASRQKQTASSYDNVPIRSHDCDEVINPPRAGRINTPYNVEIDGPIRGNTSNRYDPNPSLEFHDRIVLSGRDASEGE
jgi:hypothetical protein